MEFIESTEELCDEMRQVLRTFEKIEGFSILKDGECLRETSLKRSNKSNLNFFVAEGLPLLGTLLREDLKWRVNKFRTVNGKLKIELPRVGECDVVFY